MSRAIVRDTQSQLAPSAAIIEVLDEQTGIIHSADALLGSDRQQAMRVRVRSSEALKRERDRYLGPQFCVPVFWALI